MENVNLLYWGERGKEKASAILSMVYEMAYGRTISLQKNDPSKAFSLQVENESTLVHMATAVRMQKIDCSLPDDLMADVEHRFKARMNRNTVTTVTLMDCDSAQLRKFIPSIDTKTALDKRLSKTDLFVYCLPSSILEDLISLRGKTSLREMTREEQSKYLRISMEANQFKTMMLYTRKEVCWPINVLLFVIEDNPKSSRKQLTIALKQFIRQYGLRVYGMKLMGCCATSSRGGQSSIENHVETPKNFVSEGCEIPLLLACGVQWTKEAKLWMQQEAQRAEEECKQRMEAYWRDWRSFVPGGLAAKALLFPRLRERCYDEMHSRIRNANGNNPFFEQLRTVLCYLDNRYTNGVIYMDEQGNEQTLKEFFGNV